MTNEEEKILEEEEVTLEEAAEEADELQEETQDEGRAIEIPVERREDVNLEDVLERQVLRGGLRGAADPNMIQKHIDNFLAMLCGETPVDSNVRTSAEYWLKRLATGEGAGSTKKIYRHTLLIANIFSGTYRFAISCSVFNNSSTALTKTTFLSYMSANGFVEASGNFRTQSPVANFSIAGFIYGTEKLYAFGMDNEGAYHSSSSDPIDITTTFNDSSTVIEDYVSEMN